MCTLSTLPVDLGWIRHRTQSQPEIVGKPLMAERTGPLGLGRCPLILGRGQSELWLAAPPGQPAGLEAGHLVFP